MIRRLSLLVAVALVTGTALAALPAARTELKVEVPDYEVKQQGDLTEVTIPGGGVLYIEEGRPKVPYVTSWFGYPKRCRIQDVLLTGKTGAKVDSGLRLPAVVFRSYNDPVTHVQLTPGEYPREDFSWRVMENTGDSITLAITVYPFHYDPATSIGTFHKQYDFDVRYVLGDIGIQSVSHVSPVCDPGDTLRTVVRLANAAEAQGVTMKPTVLSAVPGELVAELADVKLARVGSADSVVVEWPTAGRAAGQYVMELVVEDPAGNELDRRRASFRIGNPQGEITVFEVEPQCFDIGDDIELTLGFRNTGSIVLNGSCVFRVMKAGEVVDELRQEMTDVAPGASKTFRQSWNTADAVKAAVYDAVGFVKYEGTASGFRSVMFSTNRMPVAGFTYTPEAPAVGEEVEFRAGGSSDPDGRIVTYGWRFDDGGEAADSVVTHAYYQPGEYGVWLTVIDNEGGIGTVVQTVSVPE